MAAVTENDLKELKDLIVDLKLNQVRMEERLSGQISGLDEKISGIDKRLDIVENRVNGLTGWVIGLLFVLIAGLLTLLGKVAFFPAS